MTIELALIETTARELIEEFAPEGWSFRWSKSATYLGYADYTKRTVHVSKLYAQTEPESEILDTIMHEIAHANVGPGHGHDSVWKAEARRLGAAPHASSTSKAPSPRATLAPWVGTCPFGHVSRHRFFRKPKRRYSCSECAPYWSAEYLLTYTKEEAK